MRRAVLALAVAGGLASPARAYVRSQDPDTGVCLFWTSRDIHWTLNDTDIPSNLTPADLVPAVQQSFASWQDAATPSGTPCSDMSFTYDGPTTRIDTGFDPNATNNINLIVFRTQNCDSVVATNDPCAQDPIDHPFACANKYNCWSHSADAVALTTTNYNVNTGVIMSANIELNGAPPSPPGPQPGGFHFTTYSLPGCNPDQGGNCGPTCNSPTDNDCVDWDVQNTLTHEIGHFIGLGHSHVCDESNPADDATMCPTAAPGDTNKRTLAPDDVAALCAIYPKGAPPATCTPSGHITITSEPAGGCSSTGPGDLFALALALALVTIRRLRRT